MNDRINDKIVKMESLDDGQTDAKAWKLEPTQGAPHGNTHAQSIWIIFVCFPPGSCLLA